MGRLFRGVIRVFALFFVASMLFGMGSAVVAAFARRRIETTEDPASNEPTVASVFAGERFVSTAPALRGGRVITWFAGHDVDLRGATLDPLGATLDLRTMYGATQIAVPEGWRVRSRVISIFGGTEVSVDEADLPADAPVLELRGFTLFGGARVTTSPDASWSGADHEREALPPAADRAAPVD
jgi:predicted membrane protein